MLTNQKQVFSQRDNIIATLNSPHSSIALLFKSYFFDHSGTILI